MTPSGVSVLTLAERMRLGYLDAAEHSERALDDTHVVWRRNALEDDWHRYQALAGLLERLP